MRTKAEGNHSPRGSVPSYYPRWDVIFFSIIPNESHNGKISMNTIYHGDQSVINDVGKWSTREKPPLNSKSLATFLYGSNWTLTMKEVRNCEQSVATHMAVQLSQRSTLNKWSLWPA